jgi:hypothetical protein
MAKVQPGRHTAELDGTDDDVVVFLIGMRFNKPWKVWQWWPVFTAMPRMLRRLQQDPELGLLHVQGGLLSGQPLQLCYFRSIEHLYRFAKDPDLPHLEPWRRFNRRVAASGDVGIWHETYRVSTDRIECVYGNMPPWGLGAATGTVPAGRKGNAAARRMGLAAVDEPAVAPY